MSIAASHNVVLKGLTGTIEAALRATFAITNRRLASAQSRALSAHRAVLECVRMRDADGARAATVALLAIAARDLDAKRAGAHVSAPGPARSRKIPTDPDEWPPLAPPPSPTEPFLPPALVVKILAQF